jgi:hypothetical protein
MKTLLTLVIAAWMLVARGDAQAPAPTNAALRYWMAFAVMRDPPADGATSQLIERVASGGAPWDETKLGTILDDNQEALAIMQRATTLADCDWGIEYELGSKAPIAHLAKARVLGGLSVLAGIRLSAHNQTSQAVDMWLASVRFSQHIARGGSLISLLSGRRVLAPALRDLHRLAASQPLDAADRKRIEAVVRALPETGFDWSAAMKREEASIDMTARAMAASRDPRAYYAAIARVPVASVDFGAPSANDVAAFHAFMARLENALSLPLDQAREKLAEIERTREGLHPFFRNSIALVARGFDDIEIPGRRKSILEALGKSG